MRLGVNGRFLAARPTGVQRFALEVLRRLASRPGVTLFLPRGVALPGDVPSPERTSRGVSAGRVWEQLELPARARAEGISVLLHPANSAPLVGGPHVVVLHDVIPLARPADFTLAYRAWVHVAHARAARRAAAVVTVSDWSADEIARLCGIPRARVSVVRQAPGPLDSPADPAEVADVRRRLVLPERYLLAVLGGDPRKGESFLERTWSGWPEPERAPELCLVGGRSGSVHRPHPASGGSRIRRLGPVSDSDLRALYTGAVALLHPSAAEGFGRPPLEALACGTRALVAPYGPAGATLGRAADIVPLDPAAWRAAIARLLAELPGERAARIDRGRSWAAGFDWDDTVDALWSVCAVHARDAA